MRDLVPRLAALSPDAIIVNVTNPVDAMTWYILRLSGFPWQRVIGTGTLVDSARFRDILSQQVGIHPVDIRAYILGEHGDSQFAALSIATAGGEHIDATPARYKMLEQAKETAFEVLRTKGYTNYAVAMAVRGIVEAIVRDLCATLPVSVRIGGILRRDRYVPEPARRHRAGRRALHALARPERRGAGSLPALGVDRPQGHRGDRRGLIPPAAIVPAGQLFSASAVLAARFVRSSVESETLSFLSRADFFWWCACVRSRTSVRKRSVSRM